jgi:pyruvate/oxaloacetate carboxyltransferase
MAQIKVCAVFINIIEWERMRGLKARVTKEVLIREEVFAGERGDVLGNENVVEQMIHKLIDGGGAISCATAGRLSCLRE